MLEGLCLLVAQGGSLFKILPQDGSLLLFAQLVQPVVQLLILSVRLGNRLLADLGGGFVHQVDGFVRQKTVVEIPPGKAHRRLYCLLGDVYAVVLLVAGKDAAQDAHRLAVVRFLHIYLLKAPLECAVLFDIPPVLCDGGGSHQLNLTAGQLRFEDIGSVNRTFCRTCADDVVYFVDEQDDVPDSSGFVHQVFDPLFKFAAVFGTCHHRHQIQRNQSLAR